MWSKTSIASAIADESSQVSNQMAEVCDLIDLLSKITKEQKDVVGELSGEIESLVFDSSSMQPKHVVTRLPITRMDGVRLEADVPCVLCGCYWIQNAIVCLLCKCLLHPACLYKVTLSPNPRCPFCNHMPGALWQAQWGFSVDSDVLISTAVGACIAGMDFVGWMKPFDPIFASARVEEVLQSIISKEANSFASIKRSMVMQDVDGNEPHPKQVHSETKPIDSAQPASAIATMMDKVGDIGAEARLEASTAKPKEVCATGMETVLEASAVEPTEGCATGMEAALVASVVEPKEGCAMKA